MPRNQPTNRIEVDLKLLQDKNAEKLLAFGKDFDKSIDKLTSALQSWNDRVAGSGITQTGKSKNASDAGAINLDVARSGGQPHPQGKTVGEARGPLPARDGINYGWEDQGSASVAPTSQPEPGPSSSHDTDTEQDYVRAMRRIGEVPTTVRQMVGFLAESGSVAKGSRLPNGDPNRWWNKSASYASDYMFAGTAVKHALTSKFAGMQQMTNFGQDVGYSREQGPFGWMSPAFREGAKTNLKAMWSSKFGLNPNYSTGQAQAARQTINAFGYGGDTADFMAERLKQLEIHQRLSPEASMRLLDPAVRFGNVEMSQLTDTLKAMPSAARAARMNLKQFNEEVTSLAAQLAQNGPASATAYAAQLTAFSGVTGLSPEKGAAMLQDRTQTFMAMAQTGMSYAKATIGPNALAARLKAPMAIGNQVVQSLGFKDMGALSKSYEDLQAGRDISPEADRALSALGMMIESNPGLFGGMNLKELMNNARRGNVLGRTEAASQLTMLGDKATDTDYRRLIGLAGMGKKGIHGYEVDRAAFMKKGLKEAEVKFMLKTGHEMNERQRQRVISQHEQAYLQSAFGKKSGERGKKAASVTIGLSPDAQKLLKIMDKAEGGKQSSNKWGDAGWYGKKAIAGLEGALHDVPIVGGLAEGLGF